MRKHIFLATIVALAICSNKMQAQANTNSCMEGVKYSCDTLKTNQELNQMTLIGKVSLKIKGLNLVNCGKVDLNNERITAYNVTSFNFNGRIVFASEPKRLDVLEYRFGDDTVFIR